MNKTQAVLDYMKENRKITSWDAIMMFKATRLSAIIFNLRKRGYHITSVEKNTNDGTRFVEYVLVSKPEEDDDE